MCTVAIVTVKHVVGGIMWLSNVVLYFIKGWILLQNYSICVVGYKQLSVGSTI